MSIALTQCDDVVASHDDGDDDNVDVDNDDGIHLCYYGDVA